MIIPAFSVKRKRKNTWQLQEKKPAGAFQWQIAQQQN
jgi:hypothetical protein